MANEDGAGGEEHALTPSENDRLDELLQERYTELCARSHSLRLRVSELEAQIHRSRSVMRNSVAMRDFDYEGKSFNETLKKCGVPPRRPIKPVITPEQWQQAIDQLRQDTIPGLKSDLVKKQVELSQVVNEAAAITRLMLARNSALPDPMGNPVLTGMFTPRTGRVSDHMIAYMLACEPSKPPGYSPTEVTRGITRVFGLRLSGAAVTNARSRHPELFFILPSSPGLPRGKFVLAADFAEHLGIEDPESKQTEEE